MSTTIRTTLKVESTDSFPSPVSLSTVTNNNLSGTFSGFQTVSITGDSRIKLNMAPIDGLSHTVLLYVKNNTSPSTATPPIPSPIIYVGRNATIVGTEEPFIKLAQGDVALLPYSGELTASDLYAYLSASDAAAIVPVVAELTFFIGEKD